MVIWGAVWGLVLGLLIGHANGAMGALLGALAGYTLQRAVRAEVARQLAQQGTAQAGLLPTSEVLPSSAIRSDAAPVSKFDAASDGSTATVLPLPQTEPVTAPVAASVAASVPTYETPATRQVQPDPVSRSWQRLRGWLLGGNTIVRGGLLVLFVGLAFLAKYAVDNALLPPELRMAGIGALGAALLALGFRMRGRDPQRLSYALALQGGGVAVLYLTVFVSFRLYALLGAGPAFALLALLCALSTAIALLQNSMPMAFIGFAGAFAAPVLVSTGQGDHVGLFSYFLMLGLAILLVAAWRAWRALNLLGFFATFGVATLWGVLQYRPEHFATTEPFLLGFFVVYLAASVLYATRHGLQPRQAVDATLIFGLPLVAFGLQARLVHDIEYATAFSALALGAVYLGLAWWALRLNARRAASQGPAVGQWLAECFVALGAGFATLAVPLALDGRWTAAVWATEGLGVYWMGMRQGRWLARAAGLALQPLAALAFMAVQMSPAEGDIPLVNATVIGALLLAGSALLLGHWTRRVWAVEGSRWAQKVQRLEQGLSPVLFWAGVLWVQVALGHEITRTQRDVNGVWHAAFGVALQRHLQLLAWVGTAWALHLLARPSRRTPWPIAATPAWFSLPLMLMYALQGMGDMDHVFQSWGWLVWPTAMGLHYHVLRSLDAGPPQRLWSWMHSGSVWLLVLLLGNMLAWAVQQAQLNDTAWGSVVLLTAGTLVLLGLTHPGLYDPHSRVRQRWPLAPHVLAYLWRGALPLAGALVLGALAVAVHSDGNARPLPFIPLLNPVDLAALLALVVCALWRMRLLASGLAVADWLADRRWLVVLAAAGFVVMNTAWLRAVHHWAGVAWDVDVLLRSSLVQAGYSILWTVLALGLMVWAHRRAVRQLWMGGAVLLGLTVVKLFLVDLSNRGGSERIVAFIAVGLMMLVVGYFAPLPPPLEGTDAAGAAKEDA